MLKRFQEHPASVGETYGQHLVHATGFGVAMICNGVACLLHGLLPFLFETTGSRAINRLHDKMVVNRTAAAREQQPLPQQQAS